MCFCREILLNIWENGHNLGELTERGGSVGKFSKILRRIVNLGELMQKSVSVWKFLVFGRMGTIWEDYHNLGESMEESVSVGKFS